MKLRTILLLINSLIVLINPSLKAQSNNQEGFIITLDFDTIYGKIENKSYFENSRICNFKYGTGDSVIRYTPTMIYGYHFTGGKFYISKSVDSVKIFLEFLVHGEIDFYFYQDADGINHYYTSKDTLPVLELKYSEGITNIDGKEVFYKTERFRGPLIYYTRDYPEIRTKINEMDEPTHRNLIKFAEDYQALACKNNKCIVYEKPMKNKLKLSIYGGEVVYFHNNRYFNQSTKIYPYIGVNFLVQQLQRRENFYMGLGFESTVNHSSKTDYRIPVSFNYLSPKENFCPLFTYEFDIYRVFATQALKTGIKYQIKKISFILYADIKTIMFVIPMGTSIHGGLMYNLNN